MELLDSEKPIEQEGGKNLALFGIISFILAALAGLIMLVGVYKSYSALNTNGAPDAATLSRGILFIGYSQMVQIPTVILGMVLCLMAFSKNHHKLLGWRILLVCNIIIFISGISNLISLILAGVMLGHLFTKKQFYFAENTEGYNNN